MAKPTRRRGVLIEDDPTEPTDGTEPTDQTADALGGVEVRGHRPPELRLSRVDPDDGEEKFIWKTTNVDAVDEAFVKRKFGGGKFVRVIYGKRGDGKFGYLKDTRQVINIDASVPFKKAAVVEEEGAVPAPTGGTMEALQQNQVIQLIREQNETRSQTSLMMMQMMKMMSDSATANTQAMAAMIQAMKPSGSGLGEAIPLIVPVLTALLSRKDPTEIAAQLMALTKENAPGGIGQLEAILEVADRINRRANGEDVSLIGVIKESLPSAIDAIGKIATARTQQAPPAAPPPALPPSPAAPTATLAPPVTEEPAPVPTDEFTPLEPYIPQAVALAENGADPHGMAQTLLTLAPGRTKAMLREFLTRDDAPAFLVQRFPALAPYPSWVADVVEELRAELFGDPLDDDPTDPSPAEPEPPPA